VDAVQRQLEAYNARDVDAFVACYAQDVVIEDADGGLQMSGRDQMRERYGELFESAPNLHAEVPCRIRVGSYVVDEERVSGHPRGGDVHAVAIYRLDDGGLIDRVRFLQ
jgi:hypothetical protein